MLAERVRAERVRAGSRGKAVLVPWGMLGKRGLPVEALGRLRLAAEGNPRAGPQDRLQLVAEDRLRLAEAQDRL